MAVHQNRVQTWASFIRAAGVCMSRYRLQVIQEITATLLLAGLSYFAMTTGYGVVALFGTLGIGVINTVTLSELYRAIREVQAENRDQISAETTETKE